MSYVVLITHADRDVEVVGAFAESEHAREWAKEYFTSPDLHNLSNCYFRIRKMRNREDVDDRRQSCL